MQVLKRALSASAVATASKLKGWTRTPTPSTYSYYSPEFLNEVDRISPLKYPSNNEHVDSELLLLDHLPKKKDLAVLTIAGGADNYLRLLADERVSRVVVIDMNPHQLALAQLKLALACSDLSVSELLAFMGFNTFIKDNANTKTERVALFEHVVETTHLVSSQVEQLFRNDLWHEVQTGIGLFGSGESMFRHHHEQLAKRGFDREDIWNGSVDFEALKQNILHDPTCFDSHELGIVGGIADLNPYYLDIWHTMAIPRAREQFCLVAEQGIHNFMTSLMMRGYYDETTLPPWMTDTIRQSIRNKKDQVSFLSTPIDQVPSKEGPFDLITPSNIFDWMDTTDASTVLDSLASRLLAPDGYILLRIAFPAAHSIQLVQDNVIPGLQLCDNVTPDKIGAVEQSELWYQFQDGLAAFKKRVQ